MSSSSPLSWFIVISVCFLLLLGEQRTSSFAFPSREPRDLEAGAGVSSSAKVSTNAVVPAPPPAVAGGHASANAGAGVSYGHVPNKQGGSFIGATNVSVEKRPGGFFDDIFNIPISILGAVNQLLNNNKQGTGRLQLTKAYGGANANAGASAGATAGAGVGNGPVGTSSSNTAAADTTLTVRKNTNYNDVFNIPITALKSVNQLLNGGR